MLCGDETGGVVIDVGSSSARFGYAGDDAPKAVFSSASGVVASGDDEAIKTLSGYVGATAATLGALGDAGSAFASEREFFLESSARVPRPRMEIKSPVDMGFIEDFDLLTAIWERGMSKINATVGGHPILLSDAPYSFPQQREKVAEIWFETMRAPALYLGRSPVLQAFSLGRSSAVVVDIGASGTRVSPILDGYVLKKGIQASEVGGALLSSVLLDNALRAENSVRTSKGLPALPETAHLPNSLLSFTPHDRVNPDVGATIVESSVSTRKLLWDVRPKYTNRKDYTPSFLSYWYREDVGNDLKHIAAEVSETGYTPGESNPEPIEYELPDGNTITVRELRQVAPEMYFEPSHSDMFKDYFKMRVTAHHWHALIQAGYLGDRSRSPSPVGIQDLVYTSLSKVAPEIRLDLCQNIILTGGGSKISGLPTRLKWEVLTRIPSVFKPRILADSPFEREFSAWIGGSILASLGTFQQMWISKAEYLEEGHGVVERKCP